MVIKEATLDDGKKCIQLINLLKTGKWELTGTDIAAYAETLVWVKSLGNEIALSVKTPPQASTPKIKKMGSLPSKKGKS